jgi:hypothetical protein
MNLLVDDSDVLESIDCTKMGSTPQITLGFLPKLRSITLDKSLRRGNASHPRQRRQTASLHFLKPPESVLRIDGQVSDIAIQQEGVRISSGIGDGLRLLVRLEPVQNALICRNIGALDSVDDCEYIVLILREDDENKDIEVGKDTQLGHLVVMGPSSCERLTIHAPSGSERIVVNNMPNLRKINLIGSTKILEVTNCKSLNSVSGFGNHLLINRSGSHSLINIGGMWLNVPESVTLRTALLTHEILKTCEDLSFIKILPRDYITLCHWCEKFGLSTSDMIEGISIPQLIEVLVSNDIRVFEILLPWFKEAITLQDQYHGMRILVALGLHGLPSNVLWPARCILLDSNRESSRATTHSTESLVKGATSYTQWSRNFKLNYNVISNSQFRSSPQSQIGSIWVTPTEAYVPFHRLDLELWLQCDDYMNARDDYPTPDGLLYGENRLGIIAKYIHTKKGPPARSYSSSPSQVMVNAVMDAMRIPRDSGVAKSRLHQLVDATISALENSDDATAFDMIVHGFLSEPKGPQMKRLIPAIGNSQLLTWQKAALLVGLAGYSNDVRIKIYLLQLISQSDTTREEARDINKVATCGARAFSRKGVERLEWPFIDSWGMRYGR